MKKFCKRISGQQWRMSVPNLSSAIFGKPASAEDEGSEEKKDEEGNVKQLAVENSDSDTSYYDSSSTLEQKLENLVEDSNENLYADVENCMDNSPRSSDCSFEYDVPRISFSFFEEAKEDYEVLNVRPVNYKRRSEIRIFLSTPAIAEEEDEEDDSDTIDDDDDDDDGKGNPNYEDVAAEDDVSTDQIYENDPNTVLNKGDDEEKSIEAKEKESKPEEDTENKENTLEELNSTLEEESKTQEVINERQEIGEEGNPINTANVVEEEDVPSIHEVSQAHINLITPTNLQRCPSESTVEDFYKVPPKTHRLSQSLKDFNVIDVKKEIDTSNEDASDSVEADRSLDQASDSNFSNLEYCDARNKLPAKLRRATLLRSPHTVRNKAIEGWSNFRSKVSNIIDTHSAQQRVGANSNEKVINLEEFYRNSRNKCKKIVKSTGKLFKRRDGEGSVHSDNSSQIIKNDAFFAKVRSDESSASEMNLKFGSVVDVQRNSDVDRESEFDFGTLKNAFRRSRIIEVKHPV